MKTFRFLDFDVYTQAKVLYKQVNQSTALLKDFTLKDQARRAALLIILNIAEGSAKRSDKDFARFLQISLGSINELFACIEIMMENNLISRNDFDKLKSECESIARQPGGFTKKLRQ